MSDHVVAAVDQAPVGAKYAPFWEGTRHGKILITCCPLGHGWYWYPVPFCVVCRSELVWEDAGLSGTVFTYSVVHRAFMASAQPPFVVGLVELAQAPGVRLVSQLAPPASWAGESLVGRGATARFVQLDDHVLPVFEVEP